MYDLNYFWDEDFKITLFKMKCYIFCFIVYIVHNNLKEKYLLKFKQTRISARWITSENVEKKYSLYELLILKSNNCTYLEYVFYVFKLFFLSFWIKVKIYFVLSHLST